MGGDGVLQRAEGPVDVLGVDDVAQAPASQAEGFGHGEDVDDAGVVESVCVYVCVCM